MAQKNKELYFDLDFDGLMNKLSNALEQNNEKIISDSPSRTGKYKKGWKLQISKKNGTLKIVHEKKYRTLEHLLEFGHKLNKNKMRTVSNDTFKSKAKLAINKDYKMIKVKPKPHIIKNLDKAMEDADNIIKGIKPFKTK